MEVPAALHTRFCDLVGVRVPIVQTGMGWVAGPRLVSATANAGGLGILAGATLTFDELASAIDEVRSRTDAPFGVNLRADAPDAADRIDLLIDRGVRVGSFAMAPKADLIARLKDASILVMPSIGRLRHAEKVAAMGADLILAQGGEGGGHTGDVPTSLLIPQVVDAVDVPVIAAGGFFDGRGLVAALAYGAAGIAMGTRFLLTSDSTVPEQVKQFYLERDVAGTVRTTKVDGVPHRVLRTDLVEGLESDGAIRGLTRAVRSALAFRKLSGQSLWSMGREGLAMKRRLEMTWSQVIVAANTPMLLRAAMVDGRPDLGVMSSGQVVGVIDDLPSVADLLDRIVSEASATLDRLSTGTARPELDLR